MESVAGEGVQRGSPTSAPRSSPTGELADQAGFNPDLLQQAEALKRLVIV